LVGKPVEDVGKLVADRLKRVGERDGGAILERA
jgi:hypothetical protein